MQAKHRRHEKTQFIPGGRKFGFPFLFYSFGVMPYCISIVILNFKETQGSTLVLP